MKIRYPAYYDSFHCVAQECPDSCCKEWDILVDESTAARYCSMEGALGADLRRCLRRDGDGGWFFDVAGGRCPMWRQDGLCRIQAERGQDALCKTCREFPRLTHDYGNFMELGLELSCPEVARILFTEPPKPWIQREIADGSAPEYGQWEMDVLLRTREIMLTILADTRYSVPEALALGLLYGCRAQRELDGGEPAAYHPEEMLALGRSLAGAAEPGKIAAFYAGLEILTEDWRRALAAPQGDGSWAPELRILARYGVERYWLQAVSDFDLKGRVKMVILSCLLVRHLGGDICRTAQLYAKEIENDADNVEAILDGAHTHPALADAGILGMLLGQG